MNVRRCKRIQNEMTVDPRLQVLRMIYLFLLHADMQAFSLWVLSDRLSPNKAPARYASKEGRWSFGEALPLPNHDKNTYQILI